MKPDHRTTKRILGDLGEDIACNFLNKRGFEIIERNYLKKWGEIDIVAKKASIIHFIEVKSVSRAILPTKTTLVPHVTERYRPEDNMHPWKLKRLSRVMQTYLISNNIESDWQLDLVTVQIDQINRKARVEIVENIII
jgi:putative endonuclease